MKNKIISLFIALALLLTPTSFAEYENTAALYEDYLDAFAGYIERIYVGDVSKEDLYKKALKNLVGDDMNAVKQAMEGMMDALDEYCYIVCDQDFADYTEDTVGVRGIVGIYMQKKNDQILVEDTMPGYPAEKAGVLKGDVILSVDGVSVGGLSLTDVSNLIVGDEGIPVNIKVLRGSTTHSFDMVRVVETIDPIVYFEDGNVFYIGISTFNNYTEQYFSEALNYAKARGYKNIIIDLRNNSGGQFNQAIALAQHFVPKGKKIVSLEYKNPVNNKEYFSKNPDATLKPVVLINEYSASASEIFAGALKDNNCGYVIGMPSYGKGVVQQFRVLPEINGGVGITIANYKTPSGISIEKTGIKPNLKVQNKLEYLPVETYAEFDYTEKPTVGSTGQNVLALEQRLNAMGYDVGEVDDKFTEETKNAVEIFQSLNDLYSYGVADITTMVKINNIANKYQQLVDLQYEAAIEYFNN